MIKYFIRTTLERQLDESIQRELGEDFTLLIDFEHKPVESFINQLSIISDYDSVLLEDDIILCHNFKQRIEDVISQYPNRIVNFFNATYRYYPIHESDAFAYNQCTYYPKGLAAKVSQCMKQIDSQFKIRYQYDVLEGKALKQLGIKFIKYKPCLVQHIDKATLIQSHHTPRRSIFFIDYLDELGITYQECVLHHNIVKLKYLIMKKFQ